MSSLAFRHISILSILFCTGWTAQASSRHYQSTIADNYQEYFNCTWIDFIGEFQESFCVDPSAPTAFLRIEALKLGSIVGVNKLIYKWNRPQQQRFYFLTGLSPPKFF